jgi:PiT family inorganic phosphate transporter
VLSLRQAVALATVCNLRGALAGTAVVSTIGKGLVDIAFVTSATILCGLLGAIIWNLLTWYYGLPSSSSHALIGGIVGSTLAAAHGDWSVVKFAQVKVVRAVVTDPVTGAVLQPAVRSTRACSTRSLSRCSPRRCAD